MRPFRPVGADPSDAELLRAVAAGDAQALAELYDRHAGWLHARLARRCADPETVREVLQDTFVTVWRSAAGHRGGEAGGWLWVIAARRLVDARRAQARTAEVQEAHARREHGAARAVAPSAEERVLSGVEFGDLGTALDGLSSELRDVLRATVVDGLSTRQAAGLLGIPEGTVKTRALRARRELREALSRLGVRSPDSVGGAV
ncbi:RNA polymerase sigma factor [Streptomyces sp. S07_1.15]|uniref:RNA polymerase sigma factor n=1 Tax=Streptomyces sp. S07_1.15 TaxID=2873925 RepID=UPI001D139A0A|nr:RNA polymerase sigma factor [Streptomyces sp. S07_1.15]MCC3651741.1 RNA polymerase sigma factor [Streptomyces sp. S07_1.15]